MPLGIDERLHIVRVKVKIPVILRNDVRRCKSQKMEEALFVDLGVKRNPPIVLPVTVPIPSGKNGSYVMHLFHRLRQIGQSISEFALELLLIVRIPQNILPIVQNLGIRIEQDPIELAFPSIKPLYCRQEFLRVPVGIFRIFEKRRDLDDSRLVRGEIVSIEQCGSLVGVILTWWFGMGNKF